MFLYRDVESDGISLLFVSRNYCLRGIPWFKLDFEKCKGSLCFKLRKLTYKYD